MTSTFSGIETAYSGLQAAREALNITGQNITNAGTAGYTRQTIQQQAAVGSTQAGLVTLQNPQPGQGVNVTGIARITDELTNARMRTATAQSSFADFRSTQLTTLEDGFNEPSSTGLSSSLQGFWASWQDLANSPQQASTGSVVISDANSLVSQISTGYQAVATQWTGVENQVVTMANGLNSAADQIASLNKSIQQTLASGGSANELMDQRDQLTQQVATLAGGTVSQNDDGTVNVFVAGNLLVSGQTANHVQVANAATSIDQGGVPPVGLSWVNSGQSVAVDGGQIAGALSLLSSGGELVTTANGYNQVATALASAVNGASAGANTNSGTPAGAFFAVSGTGPAALGLSVAVTSPDQLATGAPGQGNLDGSVADKISQLGTQAGSPDSAWSGLVSTIGVSAQGANQQSALASSALTAAQTSQQAISSVDSDQENLDMVTEQASYQSAARVLTTVDQLLDTLINHTGVVGLE